MLIIIPVSGSLGVSAPGTCARLVFSSAQDQLTTFCAGAVNYPFFLPTQTNLSVLNAIAINRTSALMSMLPIACQVDIKKLICANVYLRCPVNISLTNTSTWNFNIYPTVPYPVPFQRPCVNICTNATASCLGLPNLLGFGSALNCSSLTDYSMGHLPSPQKYATTYDFNNNPTVCNDMASGQFAVASSAERYLGASNPSAACYGITSELYIPPANAVDPSLAPMLPPYVLQTLIEAKLVASFSALPMVLSAECHSALRTYFCSSYMLRPAKLLLGAVVAANLAAAGVPAQNQPSLLNSLGIPPAVLAGILNYSLTLYSYPIDTVCLDYADYCGAFIQIANISSLQPRCLARDRYGASIFPSGSETILELNVNGLGLIRVNTSANSANNTNDSNYKTICPTGYVVPDDPGDPRVDWIPGSGCAVSCQAPVWTPAEWTSFYITCLIVPWVAFISGIAWIISTFWGSNKLQSEFPLLLYAITSLVLSCYFGIMHANSFQTQFCKSNAVNYSHDDGFSWCSMQSVMLWYFGLAVALSCDCIALDQFRKVVLNVSAFPNSHIIQSIIVFGLPWISIIWVLVHQDYGYQRPTNLCLGAGDSDYSYFWKPFEALTALDGVVILMVLAYAVYKRAYVDLTPIFLLLILFPVQVTIILSRYTITNSHDRSLASFTDFTKCVFQHFDGTDSSWQVPCGLHPSYRTSFANTQWVYVCINGLPLFLVIAHIINPQKYMKGHKHREYQGHITRVQVVPHDDAGK